MIKLNEQVTLDQPLNDKSSKASVGDVLTISSIKTDKNVQIVFAEFIEKCTPYFSKHEMELRKAQKEITELKAQLKVIAKPRKPSKHLTREEDIEMKKLILQGVSTPYLMEKFDTSSSTVMRRREQLEKDLESSTATEILTGMEQYALNLED